MGFLQDPWPWYLAGPLIGLIVPLLLLAGGRQFGISSTLRHFCAACGIGRAAFFRYDWRREGAWNLIFAAGLVIGGFVGVYLLGAGDVALSDATRADLTKLGITDFSGLVPPQLVSWHALTTLPGFVTLVGGGFLVGFGARWAGGCTSGHAISGLANLQLPSLIAVLGFFAGGLLMTHVLFPLLF
jgi:uncharacterized membrane protein YedE/YeeE